MTMIDICIPYWGDPTLMKKTVNSVLAQDSDQWVLTVLDDAFPDSTVGDWMLKMQNPRIRYLRNEKNLGIVGNYQKLLTMSTQQLVMLLGCDDELMPNYVSTVLKSHSKHPSASIIHPGVKIIDENDRKIQTLTDWVKLKLVTPRKKNQILDGESLATSLLVGDWMYWPSLTFQSKVIKSYEFNKELRLTHDLAIVMNMIVAGETLLIDPEVCFLYRRHSKSASTASLIDGRRFKEEKLYFKYAKNLMKSVGWTRAEHAAKWHLTSRLNAFWIVFNAFFKGYWAAIPKLLRHVISIV